MGVRKRGQNLIIDFRCYSLDNRRVRCRENEGKDTSANRKRVKQKWKAIEYHLLQNTFDYLKFFPHGNKAKQFKADPNNVTYSEYRIIWSDTQAVRRGTSDNYDYIYNKHHKPYFGSLKLQDITDQEIQIYRRKMLDKGYEPSTVNQNIKILCMPLKMAHKQGLIDKYPCEDIHKVKENKVKRDPFSFDELKHWLGYLYKNDKEWFDLILFWSRTGLRPGELFALRWENVDFFNKQVLICENRPYYGGTGPTKTETSDRAINLRPAVIDVLKSQRLRTSMIDKWVFLNIKQNQWNGTTFREAFKYRLRLARLRVRPPIEMRHTFATLHIGAGESISWVSKALGHSSVEITLKRYNRFIPNLTRQDGSAFEKVLSNHKKDENHNLFTTKISDSGSQGL